MAISKLTSDKPNNKHDDVILSTHAGDYLSNLKVFLKKIFDKVDESIDKTNEHITKVASMQSEINTEKTKTGISNAQRDAIITNTAKVGITNSQSAAIANNTKKTGITTEQTNAIIANTAKEGITTAQKNAISANTSKISISTAQSNAIVANTAKTGITTAQVSAITANTAKTGITTAQSKLITALNEGIQQAVPTTTKGVTATVIPRVVVGKTNSLELSIRLSNGQIYATSLTLTRLK